MLSAVLEQTFFARLCARLHAEAWRLQRVVKMALNKRRIASADRVKELGKARFLRMQICWQDRLVD